MTAPTMPLRVHREAEARERFGDLPDRLAPYFESQDLLADEATAFLASKPTELRQHLLEQVGAQTEVSLPASGGDPLQRLVREAYRVPPWVDWKRADGAGRILRRAGVLGGLTLGLRCLVHGYAAPAGNKPLAWSGQLAARADRRLAETGRFVADVCAPASMHPGAIGFRTTLQVRLMHAQVRYLIDRQGGWQTDQWGRPINQHDMLATVLLFSCVFVDGIRKLGVTVDDREADDFQHLWRWVGHVIGVAPELLPATYREARKLADFVLLTQGPPDDDSRALVQALLRGPERGAQGPRLRRQAEAHRRVAAGLCRGLIGDELADQLCLERTAFRHAVPAVRGLLRLLESGRRNLGLDLLVEDWGHRYWETTVNRGLAGVPATFAMPTALQGRTLTPTE